MATLTLNKTKLIENIYSIESFLAKIEIDLHLVLKAIEYSPFFYEIVEQVSHMPISVSSVTIAKKLYLKQKIRPNLLTLPKIEDLSNIITYCSSSYHSDINIIGLLSKISDKKKLKHYITLIIDFGNQREGIEVDKILSNINECIKLNSENFSFSGIAANFGCDQSETLSTANLHKCEEIIKRINSEFNIGNTELSLGGSIFLEWMNHNTLPKSSTELRIGEAVLLNQIPIYNTRCDYLHDDAIIFWGTILEVKENPCNGRLRLLFDFGKIHTQPNELIPYINKLFYIKHSSNYSVFELTENSETLKVWDKIPFKLSYDALLQSSISPCIQHELIR